MEIILYTLVVFFATVIGATSGAGGGAIIKPVFDLIGIDNVTVIGIYATIAVFAMCLSSLYKQYRSGMHFEKTTMIGLSIGSIFGGMLGEMFFQNITKSIPNQMITSIQSILLLIVLISMLIFTKNIDKFPKLQLRNTIFSLIASLVVGILSIFIGIGGGPLNIIVLIGFMSFSTKDSTAMIFFAQIPKIIKIGITTPPATFRWEVVPFIVIAALLGGFIGTKINRQLSNKQIEIIYNILMVVLLSMCILNVFNNVL